MADVGAEDLIPHPRPARLSMAQQVVVNALAVLALGRDDSTNMLALDLLVEALPKARRELSQDQKFEEVLDAADIVAGYRQTHGADLAASRDWWFVHTPLWRVLAPFFVMRLGCAWEDLQTATRMKEAQATGQVVQMRGKAG
ncbi:hypothetical protein [Pseudogemmobacter bohemicus]|uniref:hypothetical protein n=1 Tax=Pseudogemmobacter bohemicus TaxID=2250708 RepID=UPI000DD46C88|nr:hypothetical protein [Pseudogemmobacter bohemicus]